MSHGSAPLRDAPRVPGILSLRVFISIPNVALHSLLSQRQRDAALGKFRNSQVGVLVCTDVASRGLDIPQVDLVVNYDLPAEPNDYVHRVGRTARAGRGGTAMSLLTLRSVEKLQRIEERTGKRCREFGGIEEEAVLKILNRVGKSLRVARQFMVENGLEAKLEERREKKRERKEEREKKEREMNEKKEREMNEKKEREMKEKKEREMNEKKERERSEKKEQNMHKSVSKKNITMQKETRNETKSAEKKQTKPSQQKKE